MPCLEGTGSDGHFWKYIGDADRDIRSGRGTCWTFYRQTLELMSTYTGEWSNDVRSGRGTVAFIRGHVYDGEWSNDVFQGHGTYCCPAYNPSQP